MMLYGVVVTQPKIGKFTDKETGVVTRNVRMTVVDEATDGVHELTIYERDDARLPSPTELETLRFKRVGLEVRPSVAVRGDGESYLRLSVLPGWSLVGEDILSIAKMK